MYVTPNWYYINLVCCLTCRFLIFLICTNPITQLIFRLNYHKNGIPSTALLFPKGKILKNTSIIRPFNLIFNGSVLSYIILSL